MAVRCERISRSHLSSNLSLKGLFPKVISSLLIRLELDLLTMSRHPFAKYDDAAATRIPQREGRHEAQLQLTSPKNDCGMPRVNHANVNEDEDAHLLRLHGKPCIDTLELHFCKFSE